MSPIFSYEVQPELDERQITKFLNFAVESLAKRSLLAKPNQDLVLVFVAAEKSRQLNLKYRQKDQSTDVLSFQSEDPDCIGELVLCPEVIHMQAQANDWSTGHEYCYMILHGLLHLLGFEHETDDKAAEEMYGLQDTLFFEYFPGEA